MSKEKAPNTLPEQALFNQIDEEARRMLEGADNLGLEIRRTHYEITNENLPDFFNSLNQSSLIPLFRGNPIEGREIELTPNIDRAGIIVEDKDSSRLMRIDIGYSPADVYTDLEIGVIPVENYMYSTSYQITHHSETDINNTTPRFGEEKEHIATLANLQDFLDIIRKFNKVEYKMIYPSLDDIANQSVDSNGRIATIFPSRIN